MIELVNTSLPNGLIAGTHGFSTVAMTKGVGDGLRTRLEALCAYSHRSSAHDATYASENPANWFHVVLPHGEHVVGRVAAADFDYTGRTNRLARLRVFNGREMPVAGAAEILAVERGWYSQAWEGDVRYLAEDKAKAAQLRSLDVEAGARPTAWERVFGPGSARLAQQLAWQLQKNIATGGKSIFFRTSAGWDVTGEKLLALFRDIIRLLPPELRPLATFSTYPAALPNAVSCHLRGVYDRDRSFDAISVSQTWVDCDNGRVVHPEMLPSAGDVTAASAAVATGPHSPLARSSGASEIGEARESASLFEPKKEGRDPFVMSLIAAIFLVALAGGACLYWMMRSNAARMKASADIDVSYEDSDVSFGDEESEWERDRRLKKEREEEEMRARLEAEELERLRLEEEGRIRDEEDRRRAEEARRRRKLEEDKRREDEDRRKKEEWLAATAYQRAAEVVVGEPAPPQTGIGAPEEVPPFSVFYYAGTNVVVSSASFKPRKVARQIVSYNLWVGNEDNYLSVSGDKTAFEPLSSSPCVMWMIGDKVMFDWSFRKDSGAAWFQGMRKKYDLQAECFGPSADVFAAWSRLHPDTEYVVSIRGMVATSNDAVFVTRNREMTRSDAFEYLLRMRKRDSEQKLRKVLAEVDKVKNEMIEARDTLDELEGKLERYERLEAEVKEIEGRIAELNKVNPRTKLAKGARNEEIADMKRERAIRQKEMKDMHKMAITARIGTVKRNALSYEKHMEMVEQKEKDVRLELAEAEKTDGIDDLLRKTQFQVSVRTAGEEGK